MSTQQPLRTDFATRLRSATLAEHGRIQSTPFMRALLAGELEADAYAVRLAQNYFIHQALEESADFMRANLIAGPFVSDRLHRTAALEADLLYHLGPAWKQVMSPSEPTERYRSRIREVCFEWWVGFVAHHCTRHLGDLSGGQAIRRIKRRELATGGEGFACYRFDAISNPARFKRAYRTLLDTGGGPPSESSSSPSWGWPTSSRSRSWASSGDAWCRASRTPGGEVGGAEAADRATPAHDR